MDRSKFKILLGAAAALSLIVAITLLVLGIALDISVFPRICLIIISLLFVVLAGLLGYFTYLNLDTKMNYFLYSHQARRNISVQKLTFETINSRMNRFLSGYASSEGKIWNERVFDNPYLDMPDEFKPLVAYKLLYGLAEKDAQAGWDCLANASEDTIKFICSGLRANGDDNVAQTIEKIMFNKPVNMALMRDYLLRGKKYFSGKMKKYVVDNIDLF